MARAQSLGLAALALTDHDDLGGAVRFAQAARETGLNGILGCELTLETDHATSHIVLLAESREGYGNISSLITRGRMDHPRGSPRVSLDTLARHTGGIFALTGCPRGWVPTRLAAGDTDGACEAAASLLDMFEGRLAIEVWDHHLPEERELVRHLIPLARSLGIPWVVTNDVHYAQPTGRIVHDVLSTLRHQRTLDTMGTRLRPNGEWYLKSASQQLRRWKGDDAGIRASIAIAERCAFRLDDLRPTLPTFPLPPGVTADEYLARLVEQGAIERWGKSSPPGATGGSTAGDAQIQGRPDGAHAETHAHVNVGGGLPRRPPNASPRSTPNASSRRTPNEPPRIVSLDDLPPKYRDQIAHELETIRRLGLAGYFLIVWDIVRFSRREGILCQGRGSAANSAVCYCLGITAIDPIRLELLFERFLSDERQEAPDIDIDFAHRDREAVLQYVYERYGREHAAMVCEQITYRGRSAVRDAARVLGFSVEQADILSTLSDRFSAKSTADALRQGTTPLAMAAKEYDLDPQSDRPGIPDDPRKKREEWSAERLLAERMGQSMVHGTEASTLMRASKEAARRDALGTGGDARNIAAHASPGTSLDAKPTASGSSSGRRHSKAYEPYGNANAQVTAQQNVRNTDMMAKLAAVEQSRARENGIPDASAASAPAARAPRHDHEERRNPVAAIRLPPSAATSAADTILTRAGLDPNDQRVRVLPDIVEGLHQAPRHRSIHVGGFVLTAEPLRTVVPIEPASMPNRTVIQWERDDLDPVGLVKIDLLGLGMLTVLQDCLKYIRAARGVSIDLGQLDMTDQAVYDDLCAADTIGVFQVESRAQMNTLPRLKPRSFYDLVVEVALIRPGPIQGEMVHPYLRRRANEEPVTYPHPSVEPILRRTLGIPLFQEQGMQVAIAAAGFTPGEADNLRRAMGHKRSRERMAAICEKLITGMAANGIPEDVARRIYNQINAFADYGFPESHSASFALIVYASAYLRHYYAPEFTAAILNAQPMGFYSVGTLIEDAKRHGVSVRSVDLTRSAWDHTLELPDGRIVVPNDGQVSMRDGRAPEVARMDGAPNERAHTDAGEGRRPPPPHATLGARGAPPNHHHTTSPHHHHNPSVPPRTNPSPTKNAPATSPTPKSPPSSSSSAAAAAAAAPPALRPPAVRLGLRVVRGLGAAARERLEQALRDGPFTDIADVVARAGLDQRALRALAEAGAFDAMVPDAKPHDRRRVALWRVLEAVRGDAGPLAPSRPRMQRPPIPAMSRLETTDADYRLTGLSLNGHPMRHLRELLTPNGVRTARDLHRHGRDGERVAHAGLVICRQRPGTAKGFVFLSLEDETGILNVVVTPKRFERQALMISTTPLLLVRGILQVEQRVVNLRADQFRALQADAGEAWAKGHDFH